MGMNESREMAAARAAMAAAEGAWTSADGLARLADGLERLADIIESGTGAEPRTATNLAATYAGRFYARVRDKLERDAQVPEPELEHCFKVVLAFDQVQSVLPAAAAELKIGVVEALIERYYEGHPPEKKRAVLEQLAALRPAR
jgi:hypothetical protein